MAGLVPQYLGRKARSRPGRKSDYGARRFFFVHCSMRLNAIRKSLPELMKKVGAASAKTALVGYWLLTVTVVPSNLVMLMVNGSA